MAVQRSTARAARGPLVSFDPSIPMTLPTIKSAQLVRDGGIDAVAALNDALSKAIVGLGPSDQEDLKRIFGRMMGEIVTEIINPAIAAFPELDPNDATWAAVAKTRAAERSSGT